MPGCIVLISSGRFFEASPISSILLKNARFRVSSLTEASIKLSKGCFSETNQYLPKMAILPFSANGIEKMSAAFCCCRIVLIFYS
jgi:hypothetical protein